MSDLPFKPTQYAATRVELAPMNVKNRTEESHLDDINPSNPSLFTNLIELDKEL